MRRIIVLCLIVMIALACFMPVQAKGKDRERPRRVLGVKTIHTTEPYIVDFSDGEKVVTIYSQCGRTTVDEYAEQPSSKCFTLDWRLSYFDDWTRGYALWIYPFRPLTITIRRK